MEQINKRLSSLAQSFKEALERIKLEDLLAELKKLETESSQSDFWQDSEKAQKVSKSLGVLTQRTEPWLKMKAAISEAIEMSSLGDDSLRSELEVQTSELEAAFANLKAELKFSGKYDNKSVILSIYAGAGGTDAQDWAQMLLRMYVRWAEAHSVTVKTIDQSSGEEAGIKSVTLTLSGEPFLYGKLSGEHGVHRLVRLSPFNSDNLRQTSFAKVEILPVIDTPDDVVIDEKDLKIDVYRAGGHGGQSVNTTDSAVRITHIPTGFSIAIQNERSQLQNKETAMTILRSRLAQLQIEQHQETIESIKGPNQSAEWGNQIRSYVLHPYNMVKDLRTKHETSDTNGVLDGGLDPFIDAYLDYNV